MISKFKFIILLCFFSSFLYSSEIETIYYKADEMNVNFTESGELSGISLIGNVEVIYKDIHLFCQQAEFNKITGEISCNGNVKVKAEMGEFDVENAKYYLDEDYWILTGASFSSPPFYGKGKNIEKKGNSLIIENGYITTCDLDRPHYRFGADRITYVENDYIKIEKMKVITGNYNVFYFPKFKYHIKEKQPSTQTKISYKTRIGRNLEVDFFQKNEKNDIDLKEFFHIGSKGIGTGINVKSEENNFNFQALGIKKYDEDKVQPGVIGNFQKNYEKPQGSGDIIFDWRWMYNNDFFNDFFSEKYYSKSKTYNYFSITHNYNNTFFNFNIRENAREEILSVEKLPEVQIFTPYKQISNIPIFFSNNFSLTNFYYNDDNYFRTVEKIMFENKNNIGFFTLSPFISFSGINYNNSSDNKLNYISEAGIKLSTAMIKKQNEKDTIFNPSISFYNRTTKYKPLQLPPLSPYEEMENGKFMEVNFDWNLFKKSEYTGNISISNTYDFNRNEFNNTYIDYEIKINKNFSITGENDFDFNKGSYAFGVNDLIFEKENFKYSFGTRYEEDNDICGIENWVEKRINENWKYRVGIYYDFETDNIPVQSYEIWRKLHCLTIDFKISKDRDNFSFSFLILPTIFFEQNTWKERYSQWR